ncbi:MAG: hypothetical protein NZ740_03490 [Kiritimatiellae bacterium]|nr:hypothetical protein [Kiritimatiellia bacterium]MDW8458155.1 hypothetical protein [Verrucomicrobiota bacterium]
MKATPAAFPEHGSSIKFFYRRWKSAALAALIAVACLSTAAAEETAPLIGIRLARFDWDEYEGGSRILKEEGYRLSLGTRGGAGLASLHVLWRAEAMAGRADYDGRTIGGEPLTETTEYYGLRVETDARRRLSPDESGFRAVPLLGAGVQSWLRRLAGGEPERGGYDELWLMVYGRLGAYVEQRLSPQSALFAVAALRPPIYNTAHYSLRIREDRTFSLKPGRQWTWDCEVGWRHKNYQFALFLETYAFGRSEPRFFPPIEVYQPESEGVVVGVEYAVSW